MFLRRHDDALEVIEDATVKLDTKFPKDSELRGWLLSTKEEILVSAAATVEARLAVAREHLAVDPLDIDRWSGLLKIVQEQSREYLAAGDLDKAALVCRSGSALSTFIRHIGLWLEPRQGYNNVSLRRTLMQNGLPESETGVPFEPWIVPGKLEIILDGLDLPEIPGKMIHAFLLDYRGDSARAAQLWSRVVPENPSGQDHRLLHVHSLFLEKAGLPEFAEKVAFRAILLAHGQRKIRLSQWYAANWTRMKAAAGTPIDVASLPLSKKIVHSKNGPPLSID